MSNIHFIALIVNIHINSEIYIYVDYIMHKNHWLIQPIYNVMLYLMHMYFEFRLQLKN